MATEAEMCTYRWAAGPGKPNTRSDDVYIDEKEFKDITKHRPRLACPECGRRRRRRVWIGDRLCAAHKAVSRNADRRS